MFTRSKVFVTLVLVSVLLAGTFAQESGSVDARRGGHTGQRGNGGSGSQGASGSGLDSGADGSASTPQGSGTGEEREGHPDHDGKMGGHGSGPDDATAECKADFDKYCPRPAAYVARPSEEELAAMRKQHAECVYKNFASFTAECQASEPCIGDAIKLCPTQFQTGDRDAVKECMQSNEGALSAECKAHLAARRDDDDDDDDDDHEAGSSGKMGGHGSHGSGSQTGSGAPSDGKPRNLPAACEADVSKYCPVQEESDAKTAHEYVRLCITANQASFSPECQATIPCYADTSKYCSTEVEAADAIAIFTCLQANEANLQPRCQERMARASAQAAGKTDPATVEAEISALGYLPEGPSAISSTPTSTSGAASDNNNNNNNAGVPAHRDGGGKKAWYETQGFVIAAGAVGVVCVAAAIAAIVVVRRRSARNSAHSSPSEPHTAGGAPIITYSPPKAIDVLPSAPMAPAGSGMYPDIKGDSRV